jgi:two-component system phosphate regulon sensor histidine kinase PhoR
MPRSKRRLVLYLLLPCLLIVPPLLTAGYFFFWRAVTSTVTEAAGAAALQEAHRIVVRLPDGLAPAELERRCRAEVASSAIRLTVIAADGRVLCDSEADPSGMVNHLQRPEVLDALRTGSGLARRESATVHRPLLYAAVRTGEGASVRIVRVALPLHILAGVNRHLATAVILTLAFAVGVAFLPALYVAQRIGRRLEHMIGFSRAIASGDFSARLSLAYDDELGALERRLNEMAEQVRSAFRRLQEEGENVHGILSAMNEGVVVVSAAAEVILMNRRAEAIFGLASGPDYRGRHLLEMCRDPELQDLLRALTRWSETQTRAREIALGGDDPRMLAVSVSLLSHRAGAVPGFVLVFHDITERKKLETTRRDFVANVSHELRTPLTAIRGYAETLLEGAMADPARARQFVAVIARHAQRLSLLTDDLLTLSDLELGVAGLKREAVHLQELAHEAGEIIGAKAARGQVTLTTSIPGDLPPLCGDSDRLQQVLINLLDNAVKYTPAGGRVEIAAQIAADGPRQVVEVEVRDSGVGIPASELPRLSERFYRVDKARSRELGGTGLGLAIVKHIIQAHGGRLEITSAVNVGTTVRFSVPVWAERDERA